MLAIQSTYNVYIVGGWIGSLPLRRPDRTFGPAVREKQVRPERAGLRMISPAAVDYILASSPALASSQGRAQDDGEDLNRTRTAIHFRRATY